jgi:hypothetical protein
MSRQRRLIVVSLVLMAAPLLYAVITFAARPESEISWLEPATPNTTCILPKASMRYNHMNHLKSLRDQVVRGGKREQLASPRAQGMTSCRGCHAHRERFCDRCHEQASVRPDCFGCHAY